MSLQLSNEPDAYGFLYGHFRAASGEAWSINVLPPLPEWRGQFVLAGYEPDATRWAIYVDGELAGHAENRDAVQAVIERR